MVAQGDWKILGIWFWIWVHEEEEWAFVVSKHFPGYAAIAAVTKMMMR
jgi:hypothetical protein